MREIIHIQAGTFANYVGTHFWNTQESYFTYYEDEDPIVRHDISFREGLIHNEPTLCPRLLLFDRKVNFGSLAKTNRLADENGEDEEGSILWDGNTVEYKQEPVSKSEYHTHLEEMSEDTTEDAVGETTDASIRYWSDFNRVFFSPRTVQMLPDVADWETTTGDWSVGQETFRRFDEENGLMEESLRLFIEECDNFQGLQVIQDTSTFGSFIGSMLSSFRDEYPKNQALTFALLSSTHTGHIDVNSNPSVINEAVNDALCLRALNELSDATIPIYHPSHWPQGAWADNLKFDREKPYHTSAILSAHIESATLPLRLKGSSHDISALSNRINGSSVRFGQLSGTLPVSSAQTFKNRLNFSTLSSHKQTEFSREDVIRGFSTENTKVYDDWCNLSPLRAPFYACTTTPSYPLPTSFPPIFESQYPRPLSKPVFSSLGAGTASSGMLSDYAKLIGRLSTKKKGIVIGLEDDELRELANELWVLCDGYLGDGPDEKEEDAPGEDET
ncbi:hypothetical protein SERLADRAFT_434675 [Serpula lacrymans var. lacrymans S7.9]|uniref:Tubulin nucleotide-binding domain-like protein n=1 Tax=Serpula lacrymans var. lacrymans (strain S7.9) TaxID=578457 RepID=F8NKK3_SERL9|nr:uncharacterized protein SERLADRAFT_434675 [Serpula lacrymans var. lacrymans S7.9]EGO28775.1 hypothetical protein SERLADRAFT_434675 [Serpula lacrymans var. lacrymans S7.9]